MRQSLREAAICLVTLGLQVGYLLAGFIRNARGRWQTAVAIQLFILVAHFFVLAAIDSRLLDVAFASRESKEAASSAQRPRESDEEDWEVAPLQARGPPAVLSAVVERAAGTKAEEDEGLGRARVSPPLSSQKQGHRNRLPANPSPPPSRNENAAPKPSAEEGLFVDEKSQNGTPPSQSLNVAACVPPCGTSNGRSSGPAGPSLAGAAGRTTVALAGAAFPASPFLTGVALEKAQQQQQRGAAPLLRHASSAPSPRVRSLVPQRFPPSGEDGSPTLPPREPENPLNATPPTGPSNAERRATSLHRVRRSSSGGTAAKFFLVPEHLLQFASPAAALGFGRRLRDSRLQGRREEEQGDDALLREDLQGPAAARLSWEADGVKRQSPTTTQDSSHGAAQQQSGEGGRAESGESKRGSSAAASASGETWDESLDSRRRSSALQVVVAVAAAAAVVAGGGAASVRSSALLEMPFRASFVAGPLPQSLQKETTTTATPDCQKKSRCPQRLFNFSKMKASLVGAAELLKWGLILITLKAPFENAAEREGDETAGVATP